MWGKLTFEVGFLKVSCVWNSFLQYLPRDLFWGQLSLTAFWIGGASQRGWASCCYMKFPQGGSTSSCPTRSTCNQSLRESLLPGLWIRVECAWANIQALLSHTTSSPLKLHPSLLASCLPGALLPAEVSSRLYSQEGLLSWGPQHQETWGWSDFQCSSKS